MGTNSGVGAPPRRFLDDDEAGPSCRPCRPWTIPTVVDIENVGLKRNSVSTPNGRKRTVPFQDSEDHARNKKPKGKIIAVINLDASSDED